MMKLSTLNALSETDFVQHLGGLFEHSPWIVQQTWSARPFTSRDALHTALLNTVQQADTAAQLALICAHPELAGKAAEQGQLTQESTQEQASAGLNQCSPAELAEIRELNRAYREKFGFPYILAVKGRSRHDILQNFRQRLNNPRSTEFEQALQQIALITRLRLHDLIED